MYERDGNPLDMPKLLAGLDGVAITRQAVHTVGAVKNVEEPSKKLLNIQL